MAENLGTKVRLDPNTGWPVELDPAQGPAGVPYGRYRHCPVCRGSGTVRQEKCGRCAGIPYVDGTDPNHWCSACLGRPQFTPANCGPRRIFCAGPPPESDSLNRELADTARDLACRLEGLSEDISENVDDPVEILDVHERLYVLSAQLYVRGIEDPRLDPVKYEHYSGRRFPLINHGPDIH